MLHGQPLYEEPLPAGEMTVLALLDTNEVYARSRPSLLRNVGASGPPC